MTLIERSKGREVENNTMYWQRHKVVYGHRYHPGSNRKMIQMIQKLPVSFL